MECGGCLGKLWIPARFTAGAGMRNRSMTARRARGFWTPPLKRGAGGGFGSAPRMTGRQFKQDFRISSPIETAHFCATARRYRPSFLRKRESRGAAGAVHAHRHICPNFKDNLGILRLFFGLKIAPRMEEALLDLGLLRERTSCYNDSTDWRSFWRIGKRCCIENETWVTIWSSRIRQAQLQLERIAECETCKSGSFRSS